MDSQGLFQGGKVWINGKCSHNNIFSFIQSYISLAPPHWSNTFMTESQMYSLGSCFNSVQSLSHARLFATPWTAVHQASLSITHSWSLLKLMSTELVMSSSHLICRPLLLLPSIFPSIRVFSNESIFASGDQSIGAQLQSQSFHWIIKIDFL